MLFSLKKHVFTHILNTPDNCHRLNASGVPLLLTRKITLIIDTKSFDDDKK
jgi:hypothetical protein